MPVILNIEDADQLPSQIAKDRANALYAEAEKQGILPSRVVADVMGGIALFWFRGDRDWSAAFVDNDGEACLMIRTLAEKLFSSTEENGSEGFEFIKEDLAEWAKGAKGRIKWHK